MNLYQMTMEQRVADANATREQVLRDLKLHGEISEAQYIDLCKRTLVVGYEGNMFGRFFRAILPHKDHMDMRVVRITPESTPDGDSFKPH